MPWPFGLLVAVYLFTIFGVITTVVLENRNPLKTSAWVLIIGFIPFIGLLAYIVFGQEQRKLYRINKRYYKRLSSKPKLVSSFSKSLGVEHTSHVWRKLMALVERNAESTLLSLDHCDVYVDGRSFYEELLLDISKAQGHIHIESYIFENDEVFDRLSEALIAKRKEGLDVRIIYDFLGSYEVPTERWEFLKTAGIQVYSFLPVRLPLLSSTVNYRNHRKLTIIDGNIAYVGGMNFAKRYQDGNKIGIWRDTHFRLVGDIVLALQTGFLMDWYSVAKRVVHVERFFSSIESKYPREQKNKAMAQVLFGGPLDDFQVIEQALVSLIYQAKRSIRIQTPYFLPTESLYNALLTVALSGVSIELMIPLHSDSRLTGWAMDSYLLPLMESGIRVYRYKRGFLHSKLIIVDDEVLCMGSVNMDFRSLEHNFELMTIIYDGLLVEKMNDIFRQDVTDSEILDLKVWAKRPLKKRFIESTMRLFSPLL